MLRFVFVLLAVASFSQSNISVHAIACTPDKAECKPCLRPGSDPEKPVYNKPADVTNLELDKSELRIKKREDPDKPLPYDSDLGTNVATTAVDPEGDVLTYNYTISGGRLVGTGANVRWDLNGVQAGTYTITAGLDDGCGICGKTMTQSITVFQD